MGANFPRVGLPESIQPGDILTFFIDKAYHTRIVSSVHKGYVVTQKTVWNDYLIAAARKVPYADIHSADRLVTDTGTEASPEVAVPETPIPLDLPKKLKSKRPRPPKPKPEVLPEDKIPDPPEPEQDLPDDLAELWACLDDT